MNNDNTDDVMRAADQSGATERDIALMREAVRLLEQCPECEVPVAAVVTLDGEIVASGVNGR